MRMKKIYLLSLSLIICVGVLFAAAANADSDHSYRIKAYIGQLEAKLQTARSDKDGKRVQLLEKMINEQKQALAFAESQALSNKLQSDEGQLAEYMEENNKAVADLKSQIDKVKSDNNDAKVGGTIFFRWQKYTANGGTKVNNFDVDRAYIDLKKKISGGASSRITLDVARISGSSRQNLFDYLKYAYIDVPLNVSGLQAVPFTMTAKLGLQHTVWIDWADKILNTRYIAKSMVDNEGIMSSADFGLGAAGKISPAGLPEIDYHATVLNGSGYATTEGNSEKSVALRLNSDLYQDAIGGKFVVGAYTNIEAMKATLAPANSNQQTGFDLSYKHALGALNCELITGQKSSKKISGLSLGTIINIGSAFNFLPNLNVFARMDNYDPDTSKANDEKKKSFYGLTYDWSKDFKVAFDLQNSQTGNGTVTSIAYLHTMINL
jgi:hypothetical protein